MELLIIRHGEAVEDAPGLGDSGRWLTGKGRKVTRKVGQWLSMREERKPVEIWTSPIVRAVQTAEILAGCADVSDELVVQPGLSTTGTPGDVYKQLTAYKGHGPLALVGHEPGLSFLAVQLMGASVDWPGFKKSGVLALRWSGSGNAQFRFVLHPKTLEVETDPSRLHS